MKRTICALLAALLLSGLFAGCDLQNRKPSTDFIPVTEPTAPTETEAPEPTETTAPPTTELMQAVVRDLVAEEGSYTDRYGNTYTYKYHVPYLDAESRYAAGCNREIDRTFGSEVTAARSAMQNLATLTVTTIDYMTRLRGDFLTLYLWMVDVAGEETRAVYTVDRFSGNEVTTAQLIAYLGLDEERFLALAKQTALEAFEDAYGDYAWDEQINYERAKERTTDEANFTDISAYIDENDQLVILVNLYDLAGARHAEALTVALDTPETPEE